MQNHLRTKAAVKYASIEDTVQGVQDSSQCAGEVMHSSREYAKTQ